MVERLNGGIDAGWLAGHKHRCVWHASFTTSGYEALALMTVQLRISLFRFLLDNDMKKARF